MLCLADRQFFGHVLWGEAAATGADLLWRVKRNLRLPREARLADGSYLSTTTWARRTGGTGPPASGCGWSSTAWRAWPRPEPLYRLVTTILDPAAAPATELAALYHERWEVEGALAELKTRLRGARMVLRSKTPALVRQEFWGLLLAHFAVRGLMHEAALRADEDPDRLSFLHAVRVVRRKLPLFAALPPSGQARPARGGAGRDPGGARREQPRPEGAARGQAEDEQLQAAASRAATDHPHRLRRRHQDRKVNGVAPNPRSTRGCRPRFLTTVEVGPRSARRRACADTRASTADLCGSAPLLSLMSPAMASGPPQRCERFRSARCRTAAAAPPLGWEEDAGHACRGAE